MSHIHWVKTIFEEAVSNCVLIFDYNGIQVLYRVYHIEMDKTKWLGGAERLTILLKYGA